MFFYPRKQIFNQFFNIFKFWVTLLLLVFLPLSLIFRIDSFNKVMRPIDIGADSAILFLFFFAAAAIISVAVLIISLIEGTMIKSKYSFIIFFNEIAVLGLCFYFFLRSLQLWIFKAFDLLYPIRYIFIGSLCIVTILYCFNLGVRGKIKAMIDESFRVIIILLMLSLVLIGYKITFIALKRNNTVNLMKNSVAVNTKSTLKSSTPNIILITFDALAADDMSLYGYHLQTTPSIDSFARHSFVFDKMAANSNWTRPTIASILTGKYPSEHGLIYRGHQVCFLQNNIKQESLVSLLSHIGYNTAAVTTNDLYAHPYTNGTYQLFDYINIENLNNNIGIDAKIVFFIKRILARHFLNLELRAPILLADILTDNFSYIRALFHYSNPYLQVYPSELTFHAAQSYVQLANKPFFLWVHVYPPHIPYLPAEPFKYHFLKPGIFDNIDSQMVYADVKYKKEDQGYVDALRLRYDEYILNADSNFGNFIKKLKEEGYYKKSLIIVSADHGESFEKEYVGHNGSYLYQQLIHIPLIIHLPGQSKGKRVNSNAEQIDLSPTIIDLLNVNIPGWMPGESLKKAMFENTITKKPKFSMVIDANSDHLTYETLAVIKQNFKYIYHGDGQSAELYDLQKDPFETNNIIGKDHEHAKSLSLLIQDKIIDLTKK